MSSEADKPSRNAPPAEHRVQEGEIRNPHGRPKGSIDRKKLTRKIMREKHLVTINGKKVRLTNLQLVLRKLSELAAQGIPTAVREQKRQYSTVEVEDDLQNVGFLVVPADVPAEEYMQQMENQAVYVDEIARLNHIEAEKVIQYALEKERLKRISLPPP